MKNKKEMSFLLSHGRNMRNRKKEPFLSCSLNHPKGCWRNLLIPWVCKSRPDLLSYELGTQCDWLVTSWRAVIFVDGRTEVLWSATGRELLEFSELLCFPEGILLCWFLARQPKEEGPWKELGANCPTVHLWASVVPWPLLRAASIC
jgi:hypothetical protein